MSDTQPNDPAAPGYSATSPSWIGETFTFNGGAPSQIDIVDDDGNFEDGYVETGTSQTLASDITIDGTLYPAGSTVENEFSLIDASGQEIFVVRINGENVGFAYANGQTPTTGDAFTAQQGLDGDPIDNADGASSSSEPYADIMCFAPGTLIDTPAGPRPVEQLRVGDLITTQDQGPRPIVWMRSNSQPLGGAPFDARPVLISKGALGPGRPTDDLIVSPQHRVLVGPQQLGQFFATEVLVPAKALTSLPGIRHMLGKQEITWIHFACEAHHITTSNGCQTETLLLGPMVLNGLSRAEQEALQRIFRPFSASKAALNGPPARPILSAGACRHRLTLSLRKDEPKAA
ncbi:MAG: Hint domain-containing protein [Pseudomonadota bacterium]